MSITILIMAILAATAIIALEDSGVIGRTRNTVNETNYQDEYTRLHVIKHGLLTDNLGSITVDEYVDELQAKGLIESAITDNGDGSKSFKTQTGFGVTVSPKDGYNVEIEMEGGMESAATITFTIAGTSYIAKEGMSWKTWCASRYNPGEFECLGGTRVVTHDASTQTLSILSYAETTTTDGNTSVNIITVYGSDEIVANRDYTFATVSGATMVLDAASKSFVMPNSLGYSTYVDIAEGLRTGEILGAACPGGLFDEYSECFINFNIYVKHNGVIQSTPLLYSTNIMPAVAGEQVSMSVNGAPDDTKWYYADASHNPTGSVLATGTEYTHTYDGSTKNIDLVIVYETESTYSGWIQFKKVGTGEASVGESVTLYDSNNEVLEQYTTDSSGNVILSDIPQGSYTLVGKYYSVAFEISSTGTFTGNYVEYIRASVSLVINDGTTHTVHLYDDTDTLLTSEITDDTGYVYFEFMPEGTYYVRMDSQTSKQTLVVNSDGTYTIS